MLADSKMLIRGVDVISRSEYCDTEAVDEINVNELIVKCRTDKDSLEILYNMFKKRVFSIAFSVLKDFQLSEDCVTETFIRLVNIKKFSESRGDGKGFIFKIARNVAMEHYRKYTRECTSMIIQSYGETDKKVEDSIYVNQLMKYLNDKQRQVVIMKCCNEFTFKEIAKILKAPETTIKSRYKKAIEIMQKKAGV